jgi:hypothetical protein
VDVNGSNGPFTLVGARKFGWIAAMRLTAAKSLLKNSFLRLQIFKKQKTVLRKSKYIKKIDKI